MNLFPANVSVVTLVTLLVVSGKIKLSSPRRVVKGKDGPTREIIGGPAFPLKDGKPVIGVRVYRLPTVSEVIAGGYVKSKNKASELIRNIQNNLHLLIPIGSVGSALELTEQKLAA